MKGDMGGAAAILAVFTALADLEVPVEVTGELCLAENMIGGDAQRPSDVITIRGGTTVEVLNTDAEGRLVMADGLALAAEDDGVDAIVDVATLTGAAIRAIGHVRPPCSATTTTCCGSCWRRREAAGEAMWHLPLWEELRDNLESDVADLDNLGEGDEAGATMAGLFLREFVDGRRGSTSTSPGRRGRTGPLPPPEARHRRAHPDAAALARDGRPLTACGWARSRACRHRWASSRAVT